MRFMKDESLNFLWPNKYSGRNFAAIASQAGLA